MYDSRVIKGVIIYMNRSRELSFTSLIRNQSFIFGCLMQKGPSDNNAVFIAILAKSPKG